MNNKAYYLSPKINVTVIDVLMHSPWGIDDRILIPFVSWLVRSFNISALTEAWKALTSRRLGLLWYSEFAKLASQALNEGPYEAERRCLPWCIIHPSFMRWFKAACFLIPHKQRIEMERMNQKLLFYSQAIYPWLFSLDPKGWGPAMSSYPVILDDIEYNPAEFTRFKNLVDVNRSKYPQPKRIERVELVSRGHIPQGDYIFFPCQVPTDRNIRYFSPFDYYKVLDAVVSWATTRSIVVVLKLHPYAQFDRHKLELRLKDRLVHVVDSSQASIHDLITCSRAVYTINSGVGLEAFLHQKPVVTFGKALYDCATVVGKGLSIPELDNAWDEVLRIDHSELEVRYAKFFIWLSLRGSIDVTKPDEAKHRIRNAVASVLNH